MSRGYGQYCPLSIAAELLCQRWTLVVVSRVLLGCRRFNEIQRSVPRMSPALLTRRLEELVRHGVLKTRKVRGHRWNEYVLTPAGEELKPLVIAMTVWGQRWARDLEPEDLDPAFLVWSLHTRMDTEAMPLERTVIEFSFTGAPETCRRFWLVGEAGEVEMCLKDPGFDVDLHVESDLRVFVETWRGIRDLRREIDAGRIRVDGPRRLREGFPGWLLLHQVADVPRMRAGRERRLSRQARSSRGSS